MRTSRPLKHAPRPLLESNNSDKGKSKGKGKAITKSKSNNQDEDKSVYSYTAEGRGKGVKQAARRLQGAREDVRASNAVSDQKNKGKKRQQLNDEDDDNMSENGDEDIEDNTLDVSNIRFKMGLDSDDDEGGQDEDDDEEIDSDLAMTDGEEAPSNKKQQQSKGKQVKRKVAADFYNDDRQEIDLDEDSRDKQEYSNSEDDDEVYMDLSEMLDRKDASTLDTKVAKNLAKAKPDANGRGTEGPEDVMDLKSFKPSLLGAEDGSELDEDEDDEVDDEEDDEEEEEGESRSEEDDDFDESDGDIDSDDPEALQALSNIISGLPKDSNKRSLPGEDDAVDLDDGSKKRRRTLLRKERTEAVPEGEYVPARSGSTTGAGNGKLTLDSLLSSLSSSQALALKKSLKPLQISSPATTEDSSSYTPISALEAEVSRLSADEAALLARERARRQQQSTSSTTSASKKSKPTNGALPAPLAPLHQAKIERKAAQEKLDEEVKKWEETVNRMKGISKDGADDPEARLVLPLMSQGKGKGTTGAELVAKFNPSSNLEKQISSLISSTGMSQSSLLATENSALMSALPANSSSASASHDAARTAQLRLARELMFRAERKAKRVAKIKSRTFRKIAKKSRSRGEGAANGEDGALDMEEMAQLDSLDGGSRAEAERERLEILRARERATLRHASGKSGATAGGRWSRSLRGMDGMDDDMKLAVKQRESKQELLRRKILGNDDGAASDDDSDLSASEDEQDLDEETIKGNAFDELASLKTDAEGKKELPKGLMGMKFMQKAMQRENDRVDGMIDDFKMQVEGEDGDIQEQETVGRGGDLVSENPGRMVFAPSAGSRQPEPTSTGEQPKKGSKTSSKTSGNVTVVPAPSSASTATLMDYNPFSKLTDVTGSRSSSTLKEEVNPWLTAADDDDGPSSARLSRKSNEKVQGKDSKTADKASARMKKEQNKSKDALRKAKSEATVEIDLDKVLLANPTASSPPPTGASVPPSSQLPATSPAEVKRRKNREDAPPPSSGGALNGQTSSGKPHQDDSSESGSDNDEDALPESLKRQQGPQAIKQRDLVARAFAGDNVVADFEAMKRAEIEMDAPKEEDLTLPGWGSWSGKGVRKQKNARKIIKHIPGIEADKRKDSKFKNVIISERKDKKAQKYLTKDLPYPYTSVKQYEQRLAQPTGVEWTTRGTHKEMTMPRVLTKPGSVIKPVTKQL